MIPTLFKYHKTNEFLFEILINKTLYCADINELNDPHDGIYLFSDTLKKSIAGNTINIVRQNIAFQNATLNNSVEDETIMNASLSKINEKEFFDLLQQAGANLNVCSFTETSDNELMWAHYADNFKGVCLEFDFSEVQSISNVLSKVTYSNNIPTINSVNLDEIKKAMTMKRIAWTNEREWRMLTPEKKIKFEPKHLKSITFGPRTPRSFENMINQICHSMNLSHVTLQKIHVDLNGIKF